MTVRSAHAAAKAGRGRGVTKRRTSLEGRLRWKAAKGIVSADMSTIMRAPCLPKGKGRPRRKEGTMAFYRLKVPCLEGFWECIETVLSKHLEDQRQALHA